MFCFIVILNLTSEPSKEFDQCKLQQITMHLSCTPSMSLCIFDLHHFLTTDFHAITQSRSNPGVIWRAPEALKTCLYLFLAHVFAVIVSEAKTLMSALHYAGLIHGSHTAALSSVCVRDKPLPSAPSREHNSTNSDAVLPLYLHAGPPDFKAKAKKQGKACSVCIYLPVSETIRQIGVCVLQP